MREKIDFYFSNITKIFSISVKFSVEDIAEYEHSGSFFQVRTEGATKPTISIPVTSSRFLPVTPELIPINQFSWEYYVSCSNEPYEVFRKDKHGNLYPSFFKILADGDENTFQAKLVRSETLYTNTPYLIVFTHQYHTLNFKNDVKVGKIISFSTMGRDFAGVVITFTNKTAKIEKQLESWKYKLEENETLTLLWPPSTQVEESMLISANYAYIFSSFEMRAHGNINVHSEDIVRLGDGITKILLNGQTKIYRKNAELVLDKYEGTTDKYEAFSITQEESKRFIAPDNGAYLFNSFGVSPIRKGTSTLLTIKSQIRHYSYGYLDRIIKAPNNAKAIDSDRLLHDILIHYKRTEAFNMTDYESLSLSSIAIQYLESCEKTGKINSVAKRIIEEGCI